MKTYITILLAFLGLQIQASELSGILQEIQELVTLSDRVRALEERPPVQHVSNPYEFVLKDDDGDGFIDDEWEEIIQKGQAIQAKVWAEKKK